MKFIQSNNSQLRVLIILSIIFLLNLNQYSFCQESLSRVNLSGVIKDAKTGEAVIGANILLYMDSLKQTPLHRGVATNKYGFYSVPDISVRTYYIFVSCVGYETKIIELVLRTNEKSRELNINIEAQSVLLGEVVVEDRRITDFTQTSSTIEIDPMLIEKLPSLGSEPDIFRALQLLPGVTSATEISTGVYVRGGSSDQNLTLVDGVQVYNPSHLGGFASTFNSDVLKNIKLIKGGFPAEYGSRLSSVLDITMREGTKEKVKGVISLSTISSRVTMEGPLDTNSTFILSARSMYLDKILPIAKEFNSIPRYNFYDANGKVNFNLSEKNKIFISGFFSRDKIIESPNSKDVAFNIAWRNATVNLTWTNISSSTLFHRTSLMYTNYNFSTLIKDEQSVKDPLDFYTASNINDFSVRRETEIFVGEDHMIKAGADFIYHNFSTTTSDYYVPEFDYKPFYGTELNVLEGAIYLQDDWKITSNLRTNTGARLYYFPSSKLITIEPRIFLTYYIFDRLIVRTAFALVNQTLHLLNRSDIYLPTDVWYPSTSAIKPSRSLQTSIGIEATSTDRTFLFSVEGYYKDLKNLYEYKDNADFSYGSSFEDQLTIGRGEAYGVELFLNKRIGNLSGWLGYTLAFTKRYFDELNLSDAYYPRFDRRHDISFVLGYDINDKFNVGATWTYGTGQAFFMPIGQYAFLGLSNPTNNTSKVYYENSARDAFRLPPFHKLDLNLKYSLSIDNTDLEIFVNIYNVYNRFNVFSKYVSYKTDPVSGQKYPILKQFTLFPFLPTAGITIKF